MSNHRNDLPAKDNLLGVCHAIGTDFGFNPILLRVPFAAGIIFSAQWTLIAYAVLGMAVLASRLLIRKPKRASMAAPVEVPSIPLHRAQTSADLALAA